MRVFILTSSLSGTAAAALPVIAKLPGVEVAGILRSRGVLTQRQRSRLRRRQLKKILAIGPLGALNGIKMRRWYSEAVGKHLCVPPVNQTAADLGIPYEEVPSPSHEDCAKAITGLNCDLGLSLGNGYIPRSVFSIPAKGMLNIHHEYLPEFRGAQSVIWQIYKGSQTTGFTIHTIDAGIDTGAIVTRKRVPIVLRPTLEETVSITYAKLIEQSIVSLAEILRNPQMIEQAQLQGPGGHYTTPSIWQFLTMVRQHRRMVREFGVTPESP